MPNFITDSAMVSASEKSRQPEQSPEVFKEMLHRSIVPTVITYSALISTLEKGK